MEAKACGRHWIVRIDKGEEVVEALERFCREKGIRLGTVSGIGATDKATIGWFRTRTREYVRAEVAGDHEITSLTGNISRMKDDVYLHLHVNLSDSDTRAFGGHLNAAMVSGTCEVVILVLVKFEVSSLKHEACRPSTSHFRLPTPSPAPSRAPCCCCRPW